MTTPPPARPTPDAPRPPSSPAAPASAAAPAGGAPVAASAGDRILIIRLSAIGDVIHALPLLSLLRRARPQAFIGWAVDDRAARLLEGHPLIDRLHILPVKVWKREKWGILRRWKALRSFGAELRAEHYTAAIDVQGLSKSAYLGYLSGALLRIGFGDRDGREISPLFNNRRVRPGPERIHVVDRNLALLEPLLGAPPALTGDPRRDFPLVQHPADAAAIDRFWQAQNWPADLRPFFLYPFTMWASKVYPHEHLVAVARQLIERTGRPVVIGWGAPAEGDIARGLVEHINAAPGLRAASAVPADASSAPADALAAPAVALAASADALAAPAAGSTAAPTARAVLAPPTTLSEQAALLDRVLVAVGPDTGPIHIAVARGVPCVTVYGASDPLRNGPYGPAHAALTVDLPCRPCWKQRCPLTDTPLICLKKIPPERVVAAVLERAARAAPGSTPAPVQPGAAALVQSDAPVPVQPGAPVPVQLDAPTAPPGEA